MSLVTRRRAWLIPAALAMVLLGLAAIAAPLPLESHLLSLRGYDANLLDLMPRFDVRALRRAAWLLLALASAATSAGWLSGAHADRWEPYRDRAFTCLIAFGTVVSLFLVLWRAGFEAPWYSLQRIIGDPGSIPIFGHRLLLVWLARALQSASHHFGARQAFFVTQAVVLIATTYIVMRWSALFVGRSLAWTGGPLLVFFLAPTFEYFTFYDIAIVFFYTLGLWALYERRWTWFVLAVGIGTLNHENILLLIPAGVVALWGRVPARTLATVAGAALALHLGVRAALQWFLPMNSFFALHIWTNAVLLEQMRRTMIESVLVLIFSWGCGAVALRDGDSFLKRAGVTLFVLLLLVAFLVGRFNEARNFEALIPVLIALVLSFARRQLENPSPARQPLQ